MREKYLLQNSRRIIPLFCLLQLIYILAVENVHSQDLTISAYIDNASVVLNQQFELNIVLSGSNANGAPQPAPPDLSAFASYIGNQTSTNMQLINGQMSVHVTYTYHFIANTAGKFTIPQIKYDFNGQSYATKPIPVEVVKSQASGRSQRRRTTRGNTTEQQNLDDLLFLRATVDNKRVYQNESAVISYKIYFALEVNNYGISQLPNMVGFWSEDFELPKRPQVYKEVVDGRQFNVAVIKKMALFPQGAGEKNIEPLVVECEVLAPRKRRRRSSFDSFFDDPFFGFNRTVRKLIASNKLKITVLPLPENGKPSDFSGAVGNFSISARVDKQSTKTNEAVTLKVKLSGNGNVKIIPQPQVDFPGDFEVYDPKVSEIINKKGSLISGSKSFEYVLIPRFPGRQTIPPIRFSYFDINRKQYRTISTKPININVKKGEQQFIATGLASSKKDVKFIGQDIRFIQMRLPELKPIGTAFYKSRSFFALLLFPLFALTGTLIYRNRQQRFISNVAYARSKKANQRALRRLKKARSELGKGNAKQFYAEVTTALMGFMGDKLNVSAAGLMTDEVEQILRQRGIDEEIVSSYLECLRTCDFQRFAPSDSNNGDMKNFFNKAKNAIITLERRL